MSLFSRDAKLFIIIVSFDVYEKISYKYYITLYLKVESQCTMI